MPRTTNVDQDIEWVKQELAKASTEEEKDAITVQYTVRILAKNALTMLEECKKKQYTPSKAIREAVQTVYSPWFKDPLANKILADICTETEQTELEVLTALVIGEGLDKLRKLKEFRKIQREFSRK